MKKRFILIFCGFWLVTFVRAEDISSRTGFFANPKDLFKPLLADPREIQYALRLVTPVSGQNKGEIAIGDYFGLYRWALPWEDAFIQWSIAGGIFGRFDLVSEQKDFEVGDFSANMPVDIRVKKWTLRLMPYHISSHLGDDYIRATGVTPIKYTFDSYKTLLSYDPASWLRLYSGFNYIIRNEYDALGHYAVQNGVEWTSGWWAHRHAQTYFATDLQNWERVGWNPTVNAQLGIRFACKPEDRQKLSVFSEYGAGHMAFGQFFQQEESHWVLGMRFEMF